MMINTLKIGGERLSLILLFICRSETACTNEKCIAIAPISVYPFRVFFAVIFFAQIRNSKQMPL